MVLENIFWDVLWVCLVVVIVSSEEDFIERDNNVILEFISYEKYIVVFDFLDGSLIIVLNWSVGIIVGIWDGVIVIGENFREK